MSIKLTKEFMEELMRTATANIWLTGGAGKEALREEMAKTVLKTVMEWSVYPGGTYGVAIFSLAVYKGKLYVSVGLPTETFGEYNSYVWEWDGETWIQSLDIYATFGYRVAGLWCTTIFKEKLVIGGVFNNSGGVLIFDGTTWTLNLIFGSAIIHGIAVYVGQLYAGSYDRTVYRSSDGVTWETAFTLPAGIGGAGAGALAVYDGLLYVVETYPLAALIDYTPNAYRVFSWDGAVLTLVYTLPRGGGVQDCIAVFQPYLSGAYEYPDYLYIGTTSGDIIRFDGTTWVKLATLDMPIVGLNRQGVGGDGRAGSIVLVVTCGFYRHTGGPDFIPLLHTGSVWISDGVAWQRILKTPSACFSRSETYGGLLLISTLYHKELSHGYLFGFDPTALESLKSFPPRQFYFVEEDGTLWKAASILANDRTFQIPCVGYHEKSVYFLSDTGGTLTIEIDPLGDDNWQTLETRVIIANTLDYVLIEVDFAYIRVSFDQASTVTAWLNLLRGD